MLNQWNLNMCGYLYIHPNDSIGYSGTKWKGEHKIFQAEKLKY